MYIYIQHICKTSTTKKTGQSLIFAELVSSTAPKRPALLQVLTWHPGMPSIQQIPILRHQCHRWPEILPAMRLGSVSVKHNTGLARSFVFFWEGKQGYNVTYSNNGKKIRGKKKRRLMDTNKTANMVEKFIHKTFRGGPWGGTQKCHKKWGNKKCRPYMKTIIDWNRYTMIQLQQKSARLLLHPWRLTAGT